MPPLATPASLGRGACPAPPAGRAWHAAATNL
jgi:hypothetical protein